MMQSNPMKRPGQDMRGPGRRRSLGIVLGIAGVAILVFAIAIGPVLFGAFSREAVVAYLPERIVIGLVGIVAGAIGWILCGSDDVT